MWILKNYKLFLITLLVLLVIDIPYLTLNKKFYSILLDNNKLKLHFGLIAWIFVALALSYFILSKDGDTKDKILQASLLGLCIYGIYNFTNLATLDIWNMKLVVGDTLWGTFLFGLVTFIIIKLKKYINF